MKSINMVEVPMKMKIRKVSAKFFMGFEWIPMQILTYDIIYITDENMEIEEKDE